MAEAVSERVPVDRGQDARKLDNQLRRLGDELKASELRYGTFCRKSLTMSYSNFT